jgi:hypothetical protein
MEIEAAETILGKKRPFLITIKTLSRVLSSVITVDISSQHFYFGWALTGF